jgi:molecular chaperone DnaK
MMGYGMGKRIGIDLGMAYSVVAIDEDGRPRVLDNMENQPKIPSVVGLRVRKPRKGEKPAPPEILCGAQALDNFEMAPGDTIIDIRRLMGRIARDPEVQKVRQWATYQIAPPSEDTDDYVRVLMGGHEYSPVDISAIILSKLKKDAEFRLGEEVTHAVITVPAYFSEIQRAATREAGIKAGLKVMRILDEPTAAAIAFGIDSQQSSEPKNILVYDLGGGTFDVSVLMWAGKVFAPLELEGDMWLGGDNFDQLLVDHAVRYVKAEYNIDVMNWVGIDKRTRLRFLAALKKVAQATKERLSGSEIANLLVLGILRDKNHRLIDVDIEVPRGAFEEMIAPLVERSVAITKLAVNAAGLTLNDIDHVLLVGEGTKVPFVRKTIEGVFGREKVICNVRAEHAVALGAAVMWTGPTGIICQAPDPADPKRECGYTNPLDATHCGKCNRPLAETCEPIEQEEGEAGLVIGDPAPFHYGVQSAGDRFIVLVRRGEAYPTLEPRATTIATQVPNQRCIRIPVFGGVCLEKASANEKQGEIFAVLPPGLPKGAPVEVKLWLNKHQIFELAAHLEDGTSLNPRILHGDQDARAVEMLQVLEEAMMRTSWERSATRAEEDQMEQGIRAAYAMVTLGDYNGAIELAQKIVERLPGIIID